MEVDGEDEVSDEVIEDADDSVKHQPKDTDVTFGSIPKMASRSHAVSVNPDKISVL